MFLCFPLPRELLSDGPTTIDPPPSLSACSYLYSLLCCFKDMDLAWLGKVQMNKACHRFLFLNLHICLSHFSTFEMHCRKSVSSHSQPIRTWQFVPNASSLSHLLEPVIFKINMIIQINVTHTLGFAQLETHSCISIGRCVSKKDTEEDTQLTLKISNITTQHWYVSFK